MSTGPGPAPSGGQHEAAALRLSGIRVTGARCEVLRRVVGRRRPVGAKELLAELRHDGLPIGLSTVYRTLVTLADTGVLHAFAGSAETTYRLCGERPHHHVICEGCGTVAELPAAAIDRAVADAAQGTGFLPTPTHLDVRGRCVQCSKRAAAPASTGRYGVARRGNTNDTR